jgi:uncharacterized membrane protein required for colicin V production
MITWPDLVIGGIALLFALKGWKRGFVSEIGGFIALAAAVFAALQYPGTFDPLVQQYVHLGDGSAHVLGMIAFAAIVYVALLVISGVLSRFARLPIIGLGNAIGGAGVGVAKALVGVWIVLYVLLFFPLPNDLRGDLRHSSLVGVVTSPNQQVDHVVRATMPWFVRSLADPLFARHGV